MSTSSPEPRPNAAGTGTHPVPAADHTGHANYLADPATAPTRPVATVAGRSGQMDAHAVKAWRNSVFVIFTICGFGIASWLARNPTVRDSLHANDQRMGLLAFGISVGAILGLTLSSHALAALGARRVILTCQLIIGVGFVVAGFGVGSAHSFLIGFIGLALTGFGNGMCDVAMNVEGAANERAIGKTIMPLFHAAFSGGTVLGAGAGALAEHFGIPLQAHVIVIGVIVIAAALWAVRLLPAHEPEPEPEPGAKSGWRERLSAWRDSRTLLIGLVVLGMAFAEGSANDWLALAMVDGHHVSKTSGALVFAVFVAAMTAGRIVGVRVLDRYGRVPVLRVTALLAAVGLGIVIFVPNAWIALVGVVIWGFGASLGFPVGMSAAADDPAKAAARVSSVATIGYLAFLVGPPAIGFLAEHVGLLHGLLVVAILIVVAFFCTPATREPAPE